jgi:predicted 3-demethylubiquinone-9 3-methyltransferase (glyoxalase superfamily)
MKNAITTCLWFDGNASEAVDFYTAIFPNSTRNGMARYDEHGAKVSGQKEGSVMTIPFTLNGNSFLALNGGPMYKFSPATSFIITCETQEEVDFYWKKLTEGGKEVQCGWLEDKFGVSWQVVPSILSELMQDSDKQKSGNVMQAMLGMVKLDIDQLKAAYQQ